MWQDNFRSEQICSFCRSVYSLDSDAIQPTESICLKCTESIQENEINLAEEEEREKSIYGSRGFRLILGIAVIFAVLRLLVPQLIRIARL
jgi:hypothetical protein